MVMEMSRLEKKSGWPQGFFRVSGYVSRLGIRGSYLVRLYRGSGKAIVAETISAADGFYSFDNVKDVPYTVIAFDNSTPNYRAAVTDKILMERML